MKTQTQSQSAISNKQVIRPFQQQFTRSVQRIGEVPMATTSQRFRA